MASLNGGVVESVAEVCAIDKTPLNYEAGPLHSAETPQRTNRNAVDASSHPVVYQMLTSSSFAGSQLFSLLGRMLLQKFHAKERSSERGV